MTPQEASLFTSALAVVSTVASDSMKAASKPTIAKRLVSHVNPDRVHQKLQRHMGNIAGARPQIPTRSLTQGAHITSPSISFIHYDDVAKLYIQMELAISLIIER